MSALVFIFLLTPPFKKAGLIADDKRRFPPCPPTRAPKPDPDPDAVADADADPSDPSDPDPPFRLRLNVDCCSGCCCKVDAHFSFCRRSKRASRALLRFGRHSMPKSAQRSQGVGLATVAAPEHLGRPLADAHCTHERVYLPRFGFNVEVRPPHDAPCNSLDLFDSFVLIAFFASCRNLGVLGVCLAARGADGGAGSRGRENRKRAEWSERDVGRDAL